MLHDSLLVHQMSNIPVPWLAMVGAGEPPTPKSQICYDYPRPAYAADTVC